jgi:glutamate synthase (NADPH/NADH) small chain
MAEFKTPVTEIDFNDNFQTLKPLMNSTQAYYESSRCLFCYNAPCTNACPTRIDVPLFIKQIQTGNLTGAAKTIYSANYFGNTCGKVCPTEMLCEGACVLNKQGIKPLEIGRLQTYSTTKAIMDNKKLFEPGKPTGKKIAVIGAGAAGLSCASELRKLGYEVDVYEANENPSGLIIHGIAPYKITNEEVIQEVNYIQTQFGFNILYNKKIQTKHDLKHLEKDYQAVFIGIGLGGTSLLKIKGEELENCMGSIEFISQLKLNPLKSTVGKKVIVLGGGNTALDAASEAARMGSENVILAYRRSKQEMPGFKLEYELAKQAGVKGVFNISPVEITGKDKVEGIKFIRTESRDGKLSEIPGSEFTESCDMVIKATGRTQNAAFLSFIEGLTRDTKGKIIINPKNHQTGNSFYFAGGDISNGGEEVVNAVAEGKMAAQGIHHSIHYNKYSL